MLLVVVKFAIYNKNTRWCQSKNGTRTWENGYIYLSSDPLFIWEVVVVVEYSDYDEEILSLLPLFEYSAPVSVGNRL